MGSQRSRNRILVNVALDGALAAIAAPLARYLADPAGGLLHPFWFLAGGGITLLVAGLPFRLAQQYWRFSGLRDLAGVAGGSVVSAVLFSLLLLATGFPQPSATFPAIHAMTLALLLAAPRVAYRVAQARHRFRRTRERVLLVGADEPAEMFIRNVARDPAAGLQVAGLLSLASHQFGRRIHGVAIVGHADEADRVLERMAARGRLPGAVVVTEPEFVGARLSRLVAAAEAAGVPVRRAPIPTALREAASLELRPVAIVALLNRPQVPLDREGMARLVAGRRVLVTGAGGSIGAELARQVAALAPGRLLLLDHGEYALWRIELEIGEAFPAVAREAVIVDVRDATRVERVFADFRPELVFHAAALKHVPMVEANPEEGMLTNAAGTRHVADAARRAGALAMVLISTDKAVNPTSVMGASKRLAEMYCQAIDIAARGTRAGMRCVTVRFGNVLGSTGSVVPLFRRQLARGGPLTVTHPEMQRYFMTVREAVGLVLQASVVGMSDARFPATGLSEGSEAERGGIFVLDMGEPVKIVDLARQMIRASGLTPDRDVAVEFTGLRPGEKLFEELFHGREPPVPTGHPGLLMAAPRTADQAMVGRAIDEIEAACRAGQARAALAALARIIPEYRAEPAAAPATPGRLEAAGG